jgi:pyruvate-formate lyase
MNARTRQLKAHVHALIDAGVRRPRLHGILAESLRATVGEPRAMRRAKAFVHLLDSAPQVVLPHELVVGSQLGLWPVATGLPTYEERLADAREVIRCHREAKSRPDAPPVGQRWAAMGRDHYTANITYAEFQRIAATIAAELPETESIPYGEVAGVLEKHFEWQLDEDDARMLRELPWFASNHTHLKYATALECGLGGMMSQIVQRQASADGEQREFYETCRISIEACSRFIARYAETLQAEAGRADAPRASELREMAEVCAAVATGAPQSFREALQLVWMLHLISNIGDGSAMALGRFDQYMLPFYRADMADGRTTREQARELIECIWFKVNEPKMRTVQSITLGGLTPDGADGTSDLTCLCVEIAGEAGEPYPNAAVRVHDGSPDELFQTVATAVQFGCGQPMVFNDDVMLPGLAERGFPERDAREYYNMGCVEIMLAGLQPTYRGAGNTPFPSLLELVFSNGRRCGIGTTGVATGELSSLDTFERFFDAYLAQLRHCVDTALAAADKPIEVAHAEHYDAFASCFVDDCLENGLDVCHGGARYSEWGVLNSIGLGTAVDALAAIKMCVYDRRILALSELHAVLGDDFRGHEELRRILADAAPKFGNDQAEVDDIARRVYDVWAETTCRYESPHGMVFSPQMFSYHSHLRQGEQTNASADGRHRGQTLSDGMGPSQGKDTHGPTGLIRSVTGLDHSLLTGGCVFNLRLSPDHVRGAEGRQTIESLIRGYLAFGGIQLQINIMDTETLRKAQIAPEEHGDVVVRVAGFCEYFVNLDRELQNEIIARTAHGA